MVYLTTLQQFAYHLPPNHQVIFHFTRFMSLLNILERDSLDAGFKSYISFTPKNQLGLLEKVYYRGMQCALVFDRNRLEGIYKLIPYDIASRENDPIHASELVIHRESISSVLSYVIGIILFERKWNRIPATVFDLEAILGKSPANFMDYVDYLKKYSMPVYIDRTTVF